MIKVINWHFSGIVILHKLKYHIMNTYQKIYNRFEMGFIASCKLGILLSSCIGGAATMTILQNGTSPLQIFELFIVIAGAMTFNGAVLSQQKHKVIFNLLILSVLASSILIIINVMRH